MVHGGYGVPELHPHKVAQHRHERLEPAEPQAHEPHALYVRLTHGKALADRHGEGVHGETHGYKEQLKHIHSISLPFFLAFFYIGYYNMLSQ